MQHYTITTMLNDFFSYGVFINVSIMLFIFLLCLYVLIRYNVGYFYSRGYIINSLIYIDRHVKGSSDNLPPENDNSLYSNLFNQLLLYPNNNPELLQERQNLILYSSTRPIMAIITFVQTLSIIVLIVALIYSSVTLYIYAETILSTDEIITETSQRFMQTNTIFSISSYVIFVITMVLSLILRKIYTHRILELQLAVNKVSLQYYKKMNQQSRSEENIKTYHNTESPEEYIKIMDDNREILEQNNR